MKFPFLHNYTTARGHYGPSLSDPKEAPQLWMKGEQRPFYEDVHPTSNLLWAGGIAAGVFAAGFIPTRGGGHVWDYYVRGIRAVEEYSPAQVLRTFQLSTFFSQFETATKGALTLSPRYTEYLASLIGPIRRGKQILDPMHEIQARGLKLEGRRLLWGDTGKIALPWAGAVRFPEGATPHWPSAFARTIGARPLPLASLPMVEGMREQIIGAKNLPQHMWRQAGAWGTEWVSRFNRLLRAPMEMEPLATIFGRIEPWLKRVPGFTHGLAVAEGSGLRMLGKLSAKYGLGLGAAALAYQTVDWATREAEILDETLFAEGVTAGVATLGVKANVLASEVAEALGLHRYREAQEEIAPGSTSLARLAAFPLMGGLGAMLAAYGVKTGKMARLQWGGKTAVEARKLAVEAMGEFGETGLVGRIGTALTSPTRGLYARQDLAGRLVRKIATKSGEELRYAFLGKIGPTKLAAALGIAAGAALILPFLPGALIPDTRPEELEKIYTGEQEVPIRRGRWWEFGRCLTKSTTYVLCDGTIRTSGQVEVGDRLIGPNHEVATVIQVYKRHHRGPIRKFYTAHDRDISTGLTDNHIVPVLKEQSVRQMEAKDIQVGDFVEVPVFKLDHFINQIDVVETIQSPIFTEGDKVFAAQKNWFTKKMQKSGQSHIPRKIKLDYDTGLLFGYFLAEGNLSFNNGNPTMIETVHAKKEFSYVLDIERIIAEKFGLYITKRFKMTGKRTKEGCWIVRICSAVLAKLFMGLFYSTDYKSSDKSIPVIFLSANEEFQRGLIEGYWRGDGHYDGRSRIITSARKSLLIAVQMMALGHGKVCGINRHSKGEYDAWRLRFYDVNGTNPGSKFVGDRLFTRVRKIEIEDYDDIVYDFEVDHPDHLLQAGTFLVHNSAFEGQRISHYRPHWYPRMLMRAREKSIWGEEEPSPLTKWWRREFTYDVEREHYRERPYPITALPFEDVPFIGPLLAHTIGKIIKPPLLMHTEEWMRPGGEVLAEPPRFGGRIATEIGETAGGVPESPYGIKGLIGEQAYRMTEMIGLPGFAMVSMKEKLAGSQDLFDQMKQLESARRIAGFERWYWDQELGGLMGATEAFRRLYPHRRRQIPLYNPIRNLAPEWLPGPGEKAPDFWHGDPYVKVPEGELRLPGRGYEARYPELKGIEAEDYPLIHKYKILADVAPYSDKFKAHRNMVRALRKSEKWGEREEEIYKVTEEQVAAKKKRLTFQEYEYLTPMGEKRWGGEKQSDLIATLNRIHAEQEETEKGGVFSRAFGSYWEALAHNAETAWDQLTPISPGAKLVHTRSAVESYERMQLYGTEAAFWQHPWKHFIRPFGYLFAKGLGFEGTPSHIQDRRGIEEYFDTLEYVKFSRLSNIARSAGDKEAVKEFEAKKDETLFGINPFTRNYSSIFRALPRQERDYFNAFAEAETAEERMKILDMVPENEQALYIARWKLQFADDIKRARKAGFLSEEQIEEADEVVDKIYDEARTEGFPSSKALFAEYIQTRLPGESYGDWYRRTKLLPEMVHIPGPDFVGWHPSVDLEDIKLKLIQNLGCLLPTTMIHSDYISTTMIKDLKVGDTIMNSDSKKTKILGIKEQEYSGKILRIHLTGSPCQDIMITPNHLLPYKKRNQKIRYGHAKDLRKWFLLAFPSIKFEEKVTSLRLPLSEKNQYRYPWPKSVKVTNDLAVIMGWWLAEGGTNTKKEQPRMISFSLNLEKEEKVAFYIQKVLKKTFGGNPSVKYYPKKNSIVVKFWAKPVAELFTSLMGRGSLEKFIGKEILGIPIPYLLSFLKAWQQGDGWETDKETAFSTSSKRLAVQAWYVLSSLGYKPRFQRIKYNSYSINPSFRIRIGRQEQRFAFKTSQVTRSNCFWVGIKSIWEDQYTGLVYDLHIDKPYWYLTSCGLVHNSDMHDYDLWPSQAQTLVNKPYINQEAVEAITASEELTENEMRDRINEVLLANKIRPNVFTRTAYGGQDSLEINIEQDADIDRIVKEITS